MTWLRCSDDSSCFRQSPTTNLTRPLTINPNDYKMPNASTILLIIALAGPPWSQTSIPEACTGGVTIARVQGHDTLQQGASLKRPYFVTLPTIRLRTWETTTVHCLDLGLQDETTIRHSEVQQESDIEDRTTSSYNCMISKHKVADLDCLESDSASIKTSCSHPYPEPEMQWDEEPSSWGVSSYLKTW